MCGQKLFSNNFSLRTLKKPCVVVILCNTLCHASLGEANDCLYQANSTYSPRSFHQHLIRQIVLLAETKFSFVGLTLVYTSVILGSLFHGRVKSLYLKQY